MTSSQEYSPGSEGVVAGETAVSTIEGGLRYRGYDVGALAEQSNFEEVAFLLLHGELPKPSDLDDFVARLVSYRSVPATVVDIYRSIPLDAPAMMLIVPVGAIVTGAELRIGNIGRPAAPCLL